jgi:hypothetical protein
VAALIRMVHICALATHQFHGFLVVSFPTVNRLNQVLVTPLGSAAEGYLPYVGDDNGTGVS